jgi:hypothetical protein
MHAVQHPQSTPAAGADLAAPTDPLAQLDQQLRTLARERPVACFAGAVVLGFVLGKLAARL